MILITHQVEPETKHKEPISQWHIYIYATVFNNLKGLQFPKWSQNQRI